MLSDASRYGGSAHASGQLVYFSTESFKKLVLNQKHLVKDVYTWCFKRLC